MDETNYSPTWPQKLGQVPGGRTSARFSTSFSASIMGTSYYNFILIGATIWIKLIKC